jgi:endonuclease YncB( thermonuclease family)
LLAGHRKFIEDLPMKKQNTIFAAVAALFIVAGCASEESANDAEAAAAAKARQDVVSGVAIATDGDTVLISDKVLDLWAIEAPNLDNSDGWFSRAALDRLIGDDGELVCIIKVKRFNRRDLAICSNNRVGDVGRAMLQNGWAIVNRLDKKSQDVDSALAGVYQRTEKRARESRVGLWAKYPLR